MNQKNENRAAIAGWIVLWTTLASLAGIAVYKTMSWLAYVLGAFKFL